MFKRYWWILLVMLPVGMLAGFIVSAVVTYVMPKKYESHATIEIKPWAREGITTDRTAPSFIPTEMGKITSRNSLMRAVEALELVNRWGLDRQSVFNILKQIVVTENIRGTDLITIRVRHTNREDTRDIAAEVARAYKENTGELIAKGMKKGIMELQKAVREQEDKVEESRKILTIIVRARGVDGGTDPVDAQDYIDAKRDFETDQALLEQLKLKLITDKITQVSSVDTIVVHDEPVISDAPVSPNVTLNLLIGLIGGLLISPLLALPLMWWMSRRNATRG